MSLERRLPQVIPGPCCGETQRVVMESAKTMKDSGIAMIRSGAFKPRTGPGYDGPGTQAFEWFRDALVEHDVTVATEVMLPEHAENAIQVITGGDQEREIVVWWGSRNQNHIALQDTARVIKGVPAWFILKNQPWADERHWLGIVDHVLSTGFPLDRIALCHRGFHPNGSSNERGLRNIPDWEMANRVQEKTGLPMIIDPSHIGGSVDNVFSITQDALRNGFNRFMIEVHPDPSKALTDQRQQLNFKQFQEWLKLVQ